MVIRLVGWRHPWVERVIADGRAQARHMHTQLVSTSRNRKQPVVPGVSRACDDLYTGFAIGYAFDLLLAEKGSPRTIRLVCTKGKAMPSSAGASAS